MERAALISARRLTQRVGAHMRVLVDEVSGEVAIARSAADAPQIDGVVRIALPPGGARLRAGDWADVEIVAADAYDLAGRLTAARGEAARSETKLSPRSFPGTA
jgi:ribosomal protein S12 methylthiotransferase